MDNNQIINILTIVLGIMMGVLVVLSLIFIVLNIKNRTSNKQKNKNKVKGSDKRGRTSNEPVQKSYTKESIFKFMEFDNISDNMIIQNNGKRFLMVIECQGINFDLMSELEKNSVEQGFAQFLNTLRYPIQIYVQTRTVNLGSSIHTYKERVDRIASQYRDKQIEYNQKVRSGQYTKKELQKEEYELVRQRNLYEYGVDIVNNTERMSLNKNILSKHYYIIIPYYSAEASDQNYAKEEVSNIAFSELYTKAQSIISSLSVCGITSKILNSVELAELLYVAYNRDESEVFNLQKAMNAGYEDLYSTAPDVLDKRMKALDNKIERDAVTRANEAVYEAIEENAKQKRVKQKEKDLDNLIDEMAQILIKENRKSLGEDVANQAIRKIEDSAKVKEAERKGGDKDGQKKTIRRRTTRTV